MPNLFPAENTTDPFAQQRVIVFARRGTHVPTFYDPAMHEGPHLIRVRHQDGALMVPGFTVSEVAPERRWAILSDGRVLDPITFEQRYKRMYIEWFQLCSNDPNAHPGKVDLIAIPHVEDYVKWQVDPEDPQSPRLVPIGYDPHGAKTGAKPEVLYDSTGEVGRPRMEVLIEQFERDKGLLSADERKEVELYLTREQPGSEKTSPVPPLQPRTLEERKPFVVTAPCGREIRGRILGFAKNGLRSHEKYCATCMKVKAEAEQAKAEQESAEAAPAESAEALEE